jgi:hypothetical protein
MPLLDGNVKVLGDMSLFSSWSVDFDRPSLIFALTLDRESRPNDRAFYRRALFVLKIQMNAKLKVRLQGTIPKRRGKIQVHHTSRSDFDFPTHDG